MYETLTDIFDAVAVKYLKAVDVPKIRAKSKGSNQHELGGLVKAGFRDYLGTPGKTETFKYNASMAYIRDDDEDPVTCKDIVSWYDSRRHKSHRSPEYRLYYSDNEVIDEIKESDFMLVAITKSKELVMVFAPQNSVAEQQLRTIFSIGDSKADDKFREVNLSESKLLLPIQTVLAQLGIDLYNTNTEQESKLELLLNEFKGSFPKTKQFSEFARQHSEPIDPLASPDDSLLIWMSEEEQLFRLLERHIVAVRLQQGFGENGDDVNEFISFSLSVQNRRKSRVGHAFENHLEAIFNSHVLMFERGKRTEGKQTPDFLFPGQQAYKDHKFPSERLRMLGAKTSCKERWRQVLAEANRISQKHLITMEPAISTEQTEQMREKNLQLIVPEKLQQTYTEDQRQHLLTLSGFISEVKTL